MVWVIRDRQPDMSWLSRWFRPNADVRDDAESLAPDTSDDVSAELVSLLQKVARTQTRQGLRIEEIEAKLEAGFSDLRQSLARATSAPGGPVFDDCFDAMDTLDEAARVAPSSEHAQGLKAILRRLGAFLERAGYERVATAGEALDASRFRVVGVTVDDTQPAENIVRVVRAAILRQGSLVREGEVIVSSRST
jgi:molecular chaperone GrpE (heat shock protein)